MPTVKNPAALKKAYEAALPKVKSNDFPTTMVVGGHTLFRAINPLSPYSMLPKPAAGAAVSLAATVPLLQPGDIGREGNNRFTGPSYNPGIQPIGGLYCVLQQQALVNELTHYSGKAAAWAVSGKCILRVRVKATITVADISPHHSHGMRFLRSLGPKVWDQMNDPDDCSVARGIGLAFATARFLHGMSVQTVRESERSAEERGDNLVLFSTAGPVQGVEVDKVYYFGKTSTPEAFAVTRP
ncbi:MAG TPA: hypothetical protein VHW24_05070 [Bryobacteraceae bacterium]|jgi:hypothetical protein|nr:hypothetical protein [Bryobacteraceae bacterium]